MRRALGVGLAVLLPLLATAQDRSKKAYELMYEDIQLLKQQFLRIEKKLDQAADDLKLFREQVRDFSGQMKAFQAEQAKTQDEIKGVPSQFQALLEKLGQIETQLIKFGEDIQAIKARAEAPPAAEPAAKPAEKTPAAKKGKEPAKKPDEPKDPKEKAPAPVPPPSNLSSQEVYMSAYADYQKGNFDLAVDGFTIYREQFPESPLRDNAVYMIGECYYSLKKYERAIEVFDDLVINFSWSDMIAKAYFKKGLALVEQKKKDEAIAVFKLLISKYPNDEEAKSAQQKIRELQEGK